MNAKSAVLAAAAAALFAAGVTAAPGTATAGDSDKVHCQGVNACKGQTDCGTASHDCSGKNACKGKGWKKMTQAECDAAKEAMKKS